jgi:acetyl esterase/lipase
MRKLLVLIPLFVFAGLHAQTTHTTLKDLAYYPPKAILGDKYAENRCKLDLHYPKDSTGFATIVWFHGGGITSGNKDIPKELMEKGVAIVSVAYRFSPNVKAPTYIEDAAAAVAWVFQHIQEYGGDPKRIFLSGHSAGAYLSTLVTLDKSYLQKYNIDPDRIAGLISLSAQAITHFTIREERGMKETDVLVDKYAPLFYIRKSTPPILLVTGDRELELFGRYEENAYLWRMFKLVENPNVKLLELQGFNHGNMVQPGYVLLLDNVRAIVKSK